MTSRLIQVFRFIIFVFLLSSLIIGRGCFFRPKTNHPGPYFNQGQNAAWLGVDWVRKPHPFEDIKALALKLKRHQITYVFVFTSYLKQDGRFNDTYTQAATFVHQLKSIFPEVVILAWIGLPLQNTGSFNVGYVDLTDSATRMQIATFGQEILQVGHFDGLHLDPEPIDSGNFEILTLLELVRQTIGTEPILSIATRRIRPILAEVQIPWDKKIAWQADYYRDIANRVDQIAVMTYDSTLPASRLYQQFIRFQVIQVSQAVDGINVQLFIGIPTSEEKTTTHNPKAENIKSGLEGLIEGLNDRQAEPENVSGIAIYPYWETDKQEWNIYEEIWLGRK